ncbi:DUF485 domain-containing protein [Desulforamulus hydrothermalis]|uniref:DUF485 domain-containing protein n=1 Tax=Desulforamulus hydrothermalis TaxID=412895 RepID=UPI00135F1284|nr:DUF485 domain-containing protein [Desulforamulus hydrothermalis]
MSKSLTIPRAPVVSREKGERKTVREMHQEGYLKFVMARQLRLSISLFGVFVLILTGLPLLNYCLPQLLNYRIMGFTVSWLLLGVLFYPITWVVAFIYVKKSLQMEQQIVQEVKQRGGAT